MPLPLALDDVLEKEWQHQVIGLAKQLGFDRIYHTNDSRRSAHGFPDLVLVRDRAIYLELKREKGKLSDPQRDWIRALLNAQSEVYVCRPRHLELVADVLRRRGSSLSGLREHPLMVETRVLVGLDL